MDYININIMILEISEELIKSVVEKKQDMNEDDEESWIMFEKEWPKNLIVDDDIFNNSLKEGFEYMVPKVMECFYDDFRISNVNGTVVPGDYIGFVYCDYCRHNFENDIEYYRCKDCKKDMCDVCHSKNDPINKSKNECFDHKLVLYDMNNYFDNLNNELFEDLECFVSLVPIVEEKEGDLILLNCNSKSKTYKMLYLLCFDDHGRCGIFNTKMKNLNELMNCFKDIEKDKTSDDEEKDGWDEYYNMPIKSYVYGVLNNPVHYG